MSAISDTSSPPRPLTRRRMAAAIVVGIIADGLQILLGPFGWLFFDEIVDVIAMLVTTRLLGFHWLLLPTFILEFIPLADMLPTWTGCVAWVIRTRNKQQEALRNQLNITSSTEELVENEKPPVSGSPIR